MTPTISTERYDLYLGDCADVLPHLGSVGLLLTDPPYGIGENQQKQLSRENLAKARDYGFNDWDRQPVEQDTMTAARDLAKWQIIFGGNYYDLPPSPCWLVWDKQNTGDFADCELAWTNLPKATRIIHHMWNGMLRKGNEPRFHPTQKPLGVMAWALNHVPSDVATVLDPFMGSGTTGVACLQSGRRFIGIERDPYYFEIARQRLEATTGKFSPREFGGLFAEVN